MTPTAIVDYGMSNLDSVARAVEVCGGTPVFVDSGAALAGHCAIILPGVGAFGDAMAELHERDLAAPLTDAVAHGAALLGICLGMQLLATTGFEGGQTEGLGLIPGTVERLTPVNGERIPHVGWNAVHRAKDSLLFAKLDDGKDFYFVHSYHFRCEDQGDILATTPYCGDFTSCVQRDRVFGTQFHPEKSQRVGQTVLTNFLAFAHQTD